ncbi:hypothetical protein BN903_5 [Halorubrum sp. AJ67]|nr:hypothetical protein BN903_5 [Halorubrum sp. AJ67]
MVESNVIRRVGDERVRKRAIVSETERSRRRREREPSDVPVGSDDDRQFVVGERVAAEVGDPEIGPLGVELRGRHRIRIRDRPVEEGGPERGSHKEKHRYEEDRPRGARLGTSAGRREHRESAGCADLTGVVHYSPHPSINCDNCTEGEAKGGGGRTVTDRSHPRCR